MGIGLRGGGLLRGRGLLSLGFGLCGPQGYRYASERHRSVRGAVTPCDGDGAACTFVEEVVETIKENDVAIFISWVCVCVCGLTRRNAMAPRVRTGNQESTAREVKTEQVREGKQGSLEG